MKMSRLFFLLLFSIQHAALSISAFAQDWILSTADFRTEPVALQSIDGKGVHVIPAGQTTPRVVPPESFLQLDRDGVAPVEKPAKFMLHLVTGDRVGGEPVKIENDRLSWRNVSVGELTIPLSQALAITTRGESPDAGKRTEDVVVLANGDTVRGIVTAVSLGEVQVKGGAAGDLPVAVPLDAVASMSFAGSGGTATNAAAQQARAYRVRLNDGSSVVATTLKLSENKLNVTIGGDPRPLELSSVAGIEQVNGPVSWLTSRRPSQEAQTPFIGSTAGAPGGQVTWASRADTDVAGQAFLVGGKIFQRGIGVHSYSRLAYPLDGSYKAFRTRYGINDSLVRADVTVRLLLDGKVVHESKNVKAGTLSPVVVIELAGAKELVLEVDYGEGIDVEDRLNWIEPALLRELPKVERPATVPATAPAAPIKAPAPVVPL